MSWPACEPGNYRIQLRGLGTEVDMIRNLPSRVNGFESRPSVILPSLGLVISLLSLFIREHIRTVYIRGSQIPGACWHWYLDFVRLRLIPTATSWQFSTCCMFRRGTFRTRRAENGQVTGSQFALEFGDCA